jgi:hypothetical protein
MDSLEEDFMLLLQRTRFFQYGRAGKKAAGTSGKVREKIKGPAEKAGHNIQEAGKK